MTKPKKIILGLAGEIAAGKDTIADYLIKKHHGEKISFSQPIRDIMKRMQIPVNRVNFSRLGNDLRRAFGKDILSKVIAQDILKSRAKIITLPNIRLEEDIIHLKKIPGFYLVAVEADAPTRFERLRQRGQNDDDKSKTWPEFQRDAKLYTERHIKGLIGKAKYRLDNNGTFKELYKQVEELIKKLK